jgi:TfoX/Sxy family transcriptional regulator of competence genes
MAYDEHLASQVRRALADRGDVTEKRMFGGLCFMVRGHMCCGVEKNRMMLRVGPERHAATMKRPGAAPMDFTGRPMKGFLFVARDALATRRQVERWLAPALAYNAELPDKRR